MRTSFLFPAILVLAACSDAGTPIPGSDTLPSCNGTENLLVNPTFSAATDRLQGWQGAQHAGDKSFELSVEGDTISIARIGPEPWYNFEQFPKLEQVRGRDVLFKAELKLDLDSENWPHGMSPGGGLQVLVWAPVVPAIAGTRLVYESVFEHTPNLGSTDWFVAGVKLSVPENASRMKVGFVHRANGSMSFRAPALLDCGPTTPE